MENDRPQAESAGKDGRLGIIVFILVVDIIARYCGTSLPVFADRLRSYFQLDYGGLGMLLSAGAVGGLVSVVLVGLLSQLWGVRRLLIVTLWGVGVSYLLLGLGRNLVWFSAGLVLLGLFLAPLAICVPAFLIKTYPALKRRMLTVSLISSAVPGALFPLFAQYLLRTAGADGSNASFAKLFHIPLLVCCIGVLLSPLLLTTLASKPGGNGANEGATRRIRWRDLTRASTLGIFVLMGLHASADEGVAKWFPMLLESQQTHLPLSPGLVLSLYSVAYVVSRLALAALPEGYLQRLLLVLPGPVGGLLLILGVWSGNLVLMCIALPLGGLFWSLEYPVILTEVAHRAGDEFPSWYAAAMLVFQVMAVGCVNLVGQLGQATGDLRIGISVAAGGFILFGIASYFSRLGRGPAGGAAVEGTINEPVEN